MDVNTHIDLKGKIREMKVSGREEGYKRAFYDLRGRGERGEGGGRGKRGKGGEGIKGTEREGRRVIEEGGRVEREGGERVRGEERKNEGRDI